ncbi:MAG: indole-3-glycerol phosphate synthase TrpC [Planctomycetia bacterium]|nr:indole-3-glycerol phosphate synthase TrpC [Planctomycetia bacterium]
MNNILDIIVKCRLERIAEAKRRVPIEQLRSISAKKKPHRSFRGNLLLRKGTKIIAELKQASPSQGLFGIDYDIGSIVKEYETGGSAAISVLSEPDFFRGSLNDLVCAAANTDLPLLRKDFILDSYQIEESAAFGASAILLIGQILSIDQVSELASLAQLKNMDIVFEIGQEKDLDLLKALPKGTLAGINNRDLKSFDIDLERGREYADTVRGMGYCPIIMSGIRSRSDIEFYQDKADLFLIGESLIRSKNRIDFLRSLSGENVR